ncbi:hypothetical protein CRENBAI_017443 [Crenichthys baileyi]|uniref:Uncharacterized protein n=1 Tax=Crenichthys baileyi TaxID=28760 RepID=A0AAV9R675_9TELE
MYSSPELMERIIQMERDYETAVRQFYCRPSSPTPSHKSGAAAQSMSCLQSGAAAQSTSYLQSGAAAQSTSCLQSGATATAEQPTPGLQGAAAEQPTPGLQSAAAEQPTSGLQPAADFPGGSEDGPPLLPVSEGSEGGLPLILAPGLSDCVPGRNDSQPDDPQPDDPQPDDPQPDPKSASTSSTRRRGRRKRCASAEFIGGPGDASAHPTEGLSDASASPHATEGLGDASAHVTEVLASEPRDEGFEEEAPPDLVHEGFKEQFVLVLASEPRDERLEEEAPSNPVPEGFKEQFVLVLASEPRDEGSPGTASASEVPPGLRRWPPRSLRLCRSPGHHRRRRLLSVEPIGPAGSLLRFAVADPAKNLETRDPRAHHTPAEAQESQGAQALPSSHWE